MLARILRSNIRRSVFSTKCLTSNRTFASEPSSIPPPLFIQESSPTETQNTSNDEIVDIPNPFEKEKEKCILCRLNIVVNYKNPQLLSQFQSPYTGRIYGRHITGLCKQQQELVEKEILKAQRCALMPTYHKDVRFLDDPKLFNPEKPIRPHKY